MPRDAGAVVRIEGVARPLALVLGARDDADRLGFRVCLGGREYKPARGVVPGSSGAIEFFRLDMGVEGMGRTVMGASESGGDGGVASGWRISAFECGGVEAAVGEDRLVADVDASEIGERGRRASPARWLDTLR